jgi:hypothetical protein
VFIHSLLIKGTGLAGLTLPSFFFPTHTGRGTGAVINLGEASGTLGQSLPHLSAVRTLRRPAPSRLAYVTGQMSPQNGH